jgi:hypothetical protein
MTKSYGMGKPHGIKPYTVYTLYRHGIACSVGIFRFFGIFGKIGKIVITGIGLCGRGEESEEETRVRGGMTGVGALLSSWRKVEKRSRP